MSQRHQSAEHCLGGAGPHVYGDGSGAAHQCRPHSRVDRIAAKCLLDDRTCCGRHLFHDVRPAGGARPAFSSGPLRRYRSTERADAVRASVYATDATAGSRCAAECVAVAALRRRSVVVDVSDGGRCTVSQLVVDDAAVRPELCQSEGDVPGLYVVFECGHSVVRAGAAVGVAAVVASEKAPHMVASHMAVGTADTGIRIDGDHFCAVCYESFKQQNIDEFVSVFLII